MATFFENPIRLDKLATTIPIGIPIYGYNPAYNFSPNPTLMESVMLYGLDGSITPKQNSVWTMREQAPLKGDKGWGFAYDGSTDAVVHNFTSKNPNLPAGTYGITFPTDMLATYKTQKTIPVTVVSCDITYSIDSAGNPESTSGYSGGSTVINVTVPQDKTGYTTVACFPDDPNVEWDGTFVQGMRGLVGRQKDGGGIDGTLPYVVSLPTPTSTLTFLSQVLYMPGRTDRLQITPSTEYSLTFQAKGNGNMKVFFVNDVIDETFSNVGLPSGVTFAHDGTTPNAYFSINLTNSWTEYTLKFKTQSTFDFGKLKQITFRTEANAQASLTPMSLTKNGDTANVLRGTSFIPSAYTNASLEDKGFQLKARTDWNGLAITGMTTVISNPVNIKSPGSKTKTFVNGLENFDLYNIVSTSHQMNTELDSKPGITYVGTSASSNISMVMGLQANTLDGVKTNIYTSHQATDSRGYLASTILLDSIKLTAYSYIKPTLTDLKLVRTTDMGDIVPIFTISGTTSINGITTDNAVQANIKIGNTNYRVTGIATNKSLRNSTWNTVGSNGALTPVSAPLISPFESYTATFELHDSVYIGGPKSTVASSTQTNNPGTTPVNYQPAWTSTPVGSTSASLKHSVTASSNVNYIQPSLIPSANNYATYYTGEFDNPVVTYPSDDPRYHKNLRLDFVLNGTVIVGDGTAINNLTRVDLYVDNKLYQNILGGNGQNATGPHTFSTHVLNNGAGLNLDSGKVHSGSLVLYDSKGGLGVDGLGGSPISSINWSSTPDAILFDIDGDINNGGGIGIGGYHVHPDGVLDVHGRMYVSSGKDDKDQPILKEMWDAIYPEGSIYQTTDITFDPNKSWTGTWEKIVDRVLKGTDAAQAGLTGGANTIKMTVAQMPAHTHTFRGASATTSSDSHSHTIALNDNNIRNSAVEAGGYGLTATPGFKDRVMTLASGSYKRTGTTSSDAHTHTVTANGSNDNTGSGADINIEQAYYTVFIWHRTA